MDCEGGLYGQLWIQAQTIMFASFGASEGQHYCRAEAASNRYRCAGADAMGNCVVTEPSKLTRPARRPIIRRPKKWLHAALGLYDHRIDDCKSLLYVGGCPRQRIGVYGLDIKALGLQICKTLKPDRRRERLRRLAHHTLVGAASTASRKA